VATTGTIWGEKVVLRILDKSRPLYRLQDLGMPTGTHEAYSRCRVYSLCREFGIALKLFGVRRIADIAQDSCQLAITFGDEGGRLPSAHLSFEREGAQLIALVDRLSARG